MFKFFIFLTWLTAIGLTACNSTFTPKAAGYPAIELPKKAYLTNAVKELPYSFDIPTYAVVDKNLAYNAGAGQKSNWMNLQFPSLNATVYISYNSVQKDSLEILVRDAYHFANNHSNKASFIEDVAFVNPQGLQGVFFHLGGDVASPYQFFITDSSRHFLRGALYFDTTPNADSLSPVIDFIYQDLQQLVNSFRWKS